MLDLSWKCFPAADETRETSDDFGNRVLELRHQTIQSEFRFEMNLRSSRDNLDASRDENTAPTGIGAFLLPSALCDLGAPIREALRKIEISSSNDAARTASELCRWTHQSIEYSVGATGLETTASHVLSQRKGVCQDFAHVLIALCRASGIAARYVSGYNVGEGAMHAWVETLCGDEWISFDPTHNRRTRDDCVFVACGRDFRDVSPVRGSFRGNARAQMRTWCETICDG